MRVKLADYIRDLKLTKGFQAPVDSLKVWIEDAVRRYSNVAPNSKTGVIAGIAGDNFLLIPNDWIQDSDRNRLILTNINTRKPPEHVPQHYSNHRRSAFGGYNTGYSGSSIDNYRIYGLNYIGQLSGLSLARSIAPPPIAIKKLASSTVTESNQLTQRVNLPSQLTSDFQVNTIYDAYHLLDDNGSTIPDNHSDIIIQIASLYFDNFLTAKQTINKPVNDLEIQVNLILDRLRPLAVTNDNYGGGY